MDHVTALDGYALRGNRQKAARGGLAQPRALHPQVGLEPGAHPTGPQRVIQPLPHITYTCFAGDDDFIGERAFGQAFRESHGACVVVELLGDPGVEVLLDEIGGTHHTLLTFRAQQVHDVDVSVPCEGTCDTAAAAIVEPDPFGAESVVQVGQNDVDGLGLVR